jgi:hypothetical protein
MLTFNFTRIFKARGIDKPFRYLVNAGYSEGFSTRIVNNRTEKLNLKDIEKLCVMFQCTPNDLLQWYPSKNEINIENHPLYSLKRTEKVIHLTKILNAVPLNKLDTIENIIQEELAK